MTRSRRLLCAKRGALALEGACALCQPACPCSTFHPFPVLARRASTVAFPANACRASNPFLGATGPRAEFACAEGRS